MVEEPQYIQQGQQILAIPMKKNRQTTTLLLAIRQC